MSPSIAPINSQVSPENIELQLWLQSKLYDKYRGTTPLYLLIKEKRFHCYNRLWRIMAAWVYLLTVLSSTRG